MIITTTILRSLLKVEKKRVQAQLDWEPILKDWCHCQKAQFLANVFLVSLSMATTRCF